MATKENIALRLELENGVDEKGKPRFKTKSFSNVNKEVEDQALLRGAQSLAKLFDEPCKGILKIETVRLNPEA